MFCDRIKERKSLLTFDTGDAYQLEKKEGGKASLFGTDAADTLTQRLGISDICRLVDSALEGEHAFTTAAANAKSRRCEGRDSKWKTRSFRKI